MKKLVLICILLALISVTYACKQEKMEEVISTPSPALTETTSDDAAIEEQNVVARINGSPIYKEDLKGTPLKKVIMNEIFYQEGLRQGIDKTIEDKVEEYKRGLVIGNVTTNYLENLPKLEIVTDEEIETYYNDNLIKFQNVQIQEISVTDQKLAEQIRDRALTGEDFSKIASELSLPTRVLNFRPEQLTDKNMFKVIEKGSVSSVVKDGNNFKVFRIQNVKSYPLEKIKKPLTHTVIAHKRSKALLDYHDQIIKENNINVEVLVNE